MKNTEKTGSALKRFKVGLPAALLIKSVQRVTEKRGKSAYQALGISNVVDEPSPSKGLLT